MHKVNFNNLDQDLYSFTLKNNLKVYLMPFKDKKNYYAVLGTKYGSMDIDFTVNNENITQYLISDNGEIKNIKVNKIL